MNRIIKFFLFPFVVYRNHNLYLHTLDMSYMNINNLLEKIKTREKIIIDNSSNVDFDIQFELSCIHNYCSRIHELSSVFSKKDLFLLFNNEKYLEIIEIMQRPSLKEIK